MWPVSVTAGLAVSALAIGLLLAAAGRRRAAVGCAVMIGVLAVVGAAMYSVAEIRMQGCVDADDDAVRDGYVETTTGSCVRRVFGQVRSEPEYRRETPGERARRERDELLERIP